MSLKTPGMNLNNIKMLKDVMELLENPGKKKKLLAELSEVLEKTQEAEKNAHIASKGIEAKGEEMSKKMEGLVLADARMKAMALSLEKERAICSANMDELSQDKSMIKEERKGLADELAKNSSLREKEEQNNASLRSSLSIERHEVKVLKAELEAKIAKLQAALKG